MAEMQRKREKDKEEQKTVDILADVLDEVTKKEESKTPKIEPNLSLSKPTTVTQSSVSKSSTIPISKVPSEKITPPKLEPGKVDPRVKPILPAWINKPWRWMVPEDPQLEQQWLTTWGEFIIDFARVLNFHILDLQEVALVYPFHNSLLHKKLTLPQLTKISEYLIEIEKAKWWDDERTRLRIYWKTLKSFADDLFDYAFQFGYDMVTTFDIVKMKQSWSTLPPSDIRMLMKLLVESKRASWADSARKTIQFHYY
jgi:hypothetical protein